ncbi:hypothetical protein RhiJN_21672 [Ceratobasidium sp. AG-Ba]|nr:hypothetical protein RhiJN_21672 [Ceratobasidium sp. AG-Ba]
MSVPIGPAPNSNPSSTPRKLIVCVDGTSNQFSEKNTNVVELYSRIKKDPTQLTYYNSGIGTYARPFWWSFAYQKQQLFNFIDLAIAWNFEKVIIGAYRWLADNYKPGDRIFLFGFSRGAFQVRTLAAMIEQVGLIYPGNQEQIPFAWSIYSKNDENYKQFKKAFCRENVDLHFVGVWDTVASVGVFPKRFPLVDKCSHITHFRHALALDERRVKFLPEHILEERPASENHSIKQVWFVGTHSDIGGGNKSNPKLDRGGEPLKWMLEEAHANGLSVRLHDVKIGVPHAEVTNSMNGLTWFILEVVPFLCWKQYVFGHTFKSKWLPHRMSVREVLPSHSIHWTVGVSLDKVSQELAQSRSRYHPKAKILVEDEQKKSLLWKDISVNANQDGQPKWEDNYHYADMVNLLKEDHTSFNLKWFNNLYHYATRKDYYGKPDAIWAYGGPQFLHRLFKIYPTKLKTSRIARSIIGLDPMFSEDFDVIGLTAGENAATSSIEDELAEHLQDMVIPRLSLVLEQWAKEYQEPSENGLWMSFLAFFRTTQDQSVDASWDLDKIPNEDRSIHFLCAIVNMVAAVAAIIPSERMSKSVAELASRTLKVIPETQFISSSAASEPVQQADKAVLIEGVLSALIALFRHGASTEAFVRKPIIGKLLPLIQANPMYPKLALRAMHMVRLLSQHYDSGTNVANSDIVDVLLMLMSDPETSNSVMKKTLAHEASATIEVLSQYNWCGSRLAQYNRLNTLFALITQHLYVDQLLRTLRNISEYQPGVFTIEHVVPLANLMGQKSDSTFILANLARPRDGRFDVELASSYYEAGVATKAVSLLSQEHATFVQAATILMRNLIDHASSNPFSEPNTSHTIPPGVAQALIDSLQANKNSLSVTEELLKTLMRLALQESITDNQFEILSLLATPQDKQATLAVLAASLSGGYFEHLS